MVAKSAASGFPFQLLLGEAVPGAGGNNDLSEFLEDKMTKKQQLRSGNGAEAIRLIVRGDDMGMTQGSLEAFERCMNLGIMTSASVQAPAPWFEGAVDICKRNPQWDVGMHLTLVGEWRGFRWRPVLPWSAVPSLVNENGYFHRSPAELWAQNPKLEEIRAEFRAQIELMRRMGAEFHYLDTHYFSISKMEDEYPQLFELVAELGREYGVPVSGLCGEKRVGQLFDQPGISPMDDFPMERKKACAIELLESLTPGLWLWATHPGTDSPEQHALVHFEPKDMVCEGGGIGGHRAEHTALITSTELRTIILKRNIALTTYRGLAD